MSAGLKILRALSASGALCDDCLSEAAEVRPRRQVNQRCRALVARGRVLREKASCPRCRRAKIVNRIPERTTPRLPLRGSSRRRPVEPWFRKEGLRERILHYLEVHDYSVVGGDSSTEEIEARSPDGRSTWLRLVSHPEPASEALAEGRFAEALLALVLRRDADSAAELAIGLPRGLEPYRGLARRIGWLKWLVPFRFFWVDRSGAVMVE